MELPSYFADFIAAIRPSDKDLEEFRNAHTELRKRLQEDPELSKIIVTTFLQGSYRRFTAIRPKPGKKGDVDVVVVTSIDKNTVAPEQAIQMCVPFVEKHYKGKHTSQGRSIGIELEHVALDLVITASTSEAQSTLFKSAAFTEDETLESESFVEKLTKASADWKDSTLYIPDRDAKVWVPTDPLEQIRRTQQKNAKCNVYYLDVVKALKWWRRQFDKPEYPKGYPVEHLIWTCCPDGITSVAHGVTGTLEAIVSGHPSKPFLADHGVPEHDVMKRVTDDDYKLFYQHVKEAAALARKALDESDTEKSVNLWRELFGGEFPPYRGGSGGYTERTASSKIEVGGRFA